MRHSRILTIATLILAGSVLPSAARAQQQPKPGKITAPPKLLAEAKVSADSARKVALGAVRGGTIESGELEREQGKLIWSFDIKVAGRSGIDEVAVDARSGKVISRQHETPAQEAAEAAAEAKAEKAVRQKP